MKNRLNKKLQVFGLALLAQASLIGCNEQDYGIKLSQKTDKLTGSSTLIGDATPTPSSTPIGSPTPTLTITPTPTPTEFGTATTDTFKPKAASAATKIDLLMVIDNSGSMKDKQQTLIASFQSFIQKFTASGVDYRLGIISTDSKNYSNVAITSTSNPFYGYINPFPNANSTPGTLLTRYLGIPFLMPSVTDVVGKFSQNANLGIKGSGDERCIYSALDALSAKKLSTDNAGFIRPDALIDIMCVTDENEQINSDPVMVNGVFDHAETKPDQRIDRYLARMKELCPPGSACPGYRTDLVVDLSAPAPSTPITYPLSGSIVNSYPDFYLKFAARTGSSLLNIKSSTWGSELSNVATSIINQAQSEFNLSHIPKTSAPIKVWVNNVEIPANQFVYHANRNTIELLAPALANSAGGTVDVKYVY